MLQSSVTFNAKESNLFLLTGTQPLTVTLVLPLNDFILANQRRVSVLKMATTKGAGGGEASCKRFLLRNPEVGRLDLV